MAKVPLLWSSGARKEAMDLLSSLWSQADPEMREAISAAVCAGPPAELLAGIPDEELKASRDRRIFDRLLVIQRLGNPPLTSALKAEVARLGEVYPKWRGEEGERVHFNTWVETRLGVETPLSVEELRSHDDHAIAELLIREKDMREGLLDTWRRLVIDDPARGLSVLQHLSREHKQAQSDILESGLRGMREAAKQAELRDPLMGMLKTMPDEAFNQPEISTIIADIFESIGDGQSSSIPEQDYWNLFDRTLRAVKLDESNSDQPNERDWVSLALNRSMGRLATAFFAMLFARNLKVGGGIPGDLKPTLEELLSRKEGSHRPARVIAASRLSYLHAVDPEWVRAHLIPCFDWTDEAEALAVWQGYAWQPRIDEKLWLALKPYFLTMFTPERLKRLNDMGRNLAQMLMLVGIEFGAQEMPREGVRNAIRAMPEEMRGRAVEWLVSYLSQRKEEEGASSQLNEADELWTRKVKPWLNLVWPPEPALQSRITATEFALLAIATDKRFPDAVKALAPFMVRSDASHVISELAESTHPDQHPQATLDLIDTVVNLNNLFFQRNDLQQIIGRVVAKDARVTDSVVFRKWNDLIRAGGG